MIASRLQLCAFLLGCAAQPTPGSWSRRTASPLPHPPQLVSLRARACGCACVSPRGPSCLSEVSRHGSGSAYSTPGKQLRKLMRRSSWWEFNGESICLRFFSFFLCTRASALWIPQQQQWDQRWIHDVWYRQNVGSKQTSAIRYRATVCRVRLQDTIRWCTIGS